MFLADELVARKQEGRPLKVGIDGRSGAGKSTLADELGVAVSRKGYEVLRASVDDFHNPRERRHKQGEYSARGYYEDAFDYESVVGGLLGPLSGTTFPVPCRQVSFDQRRNLPLNPAPVPAGTNTILLFEGIFVFRGRLNGYWTIEFFWELTPRHRWAELSPAIQGFWARLTRFGGSSQYVMTLHGRFTPMKRIRRLKRTS